MTPAKIPFKMKGSVRFPFKRKGKKIIIPRAPLGAGHSSMVIEKCDKSGIVLKVGSVVYGDRGEVLGISRKTRPEEFESMRLHEALKKVGVDKVVALNKSLGLAGMLFSRKGAWSQKQAKLEREKAVKLFKEVSRNRQLRFLLNGIAVHPEMTQVELKQAYRKLRRRIVFAEA